ncbi:MAG: hypothetical protein ACRDB0_08370 [Paraclostridium sp.]
MLQDKLSVVNDKLVTSYSALFALDEGKRVRCKTWGKDEYIKFNDEGILVDENGIDVEIALTKYMKWYILD